MDEQQGINHILQSILIINIKWSIICKHISSYNRHNVNLTNKYYMYDKKK